jgi:acetyltransferase-like isoleucine patch superfamily enzyme
VGAFTLLVVSDDPLSKQKYSRLEIGRDAYISEHCGVRATGGRVVIGNDVLIASHACIVASNHGLARDEEMIKQPWADRPRDVIIGDDVWVGCHAVLLPGARIGNGAIAAGAVVRSEVPPFSIYGGVPARPIGART